MEVDNEDKFGIEVCNQRLIITKKEEKCSYGFLTLGFLRRGKALKFTITALRNLERLDLCGIGIYFIGKNVTRRQFKKLL